MDSLVSGLEGNQIGDEIDHSKFDQHCLLLFDFGSEGSPFFGVRHMKKFNNINYISNLHTQYIISLIYEI